MPLPLVAGIAGMLAMLMSPPGNAMPTGPADRATVGAMAAVAETPPGNPARARGLSLTCRIDLPDRITSGSPAPLRMTVINRGSRAADLLTWNTPFEGWFGAFMSVSRDGMPLPYRGPSIKRGEPARSDYLRVPAGRSRSARVDLGVAFDLTAAGEYRVQPEIVIHDALIAGTAALPRNRAAHQSLALDCPARVFQVDAAQAAGADKPRAP